MTARFLRSSSPVLIVLAAACAVGGLHRPAFGRSPRAARAAQSTDAGASPAADASVSAASPPTPPTPPTPPAPAALPPADAPARCREQPPQPFLIRGSYVNPRDDSPEERRRCARGHYAANRYRTEHYGYFPGCGRPEWNPHPPQHYAEATTFMGRPVRLHRRIIPALRCVEAEIARSCAHAPYRPQRLAGIRSQNSFRGGEFSNHVFGIAIDIDPARNPCCGCGTLFRNHPACVRPARTVFDRMAMPECWVHAFERYGFYWLGRDRHLRDTMHFEFLGDPDRIALP